MTRPAIVQEFDEPLVVEELRAAHLKLAVPHFFGTRAARFALTHFATNPGFARAAQGDRAEALTLMERCLAIKLTLFGKDHPEVRLTTASLRSLDGE